MNNNADERLDRLFAAARTVRVDTSALEEHFETRLMARLRERRAEGVPWYALMWRMVPAFAVLVVLIAVYSVSYGPPSSGDLFAAISSNQEEYVAGNVLTGE
jgi:lipopolysaccharide export LptBFGC system permease protein LptF